MPFPPFFLMAIDMIALIGLDLNYTLRNVILGSAVLGAVGGAIGCFAVLRRESLLGDTLAHAALPGICLAFLLTGTKASLGLMTGAAISGWVGTLLVMAIVRGSRIKQDAALGIVLSVFFGIGTVLLTYIAHAGSAGQGGLDRFLFGQAASLVREDVLTMTVIGIIVLTAAAVLFKEFKLLSFDPEFAFSLGLPTTRLTVALTTLIVIAVVIGLQAVGVILMVSVLIAPALAARQWTNRLGTMVFLAAGFGSVAGVTGSVLSSEIARLPTGPAIVLVATTFVAISVLFAPERGVVWAAIRQFRQRRRYVASGLLIDLSKLEHALEWATQGGAVPVTALSTRTGQEIRTLHRTLRSLSHRGYVERGDGDRWTLTPTGREVATKAERREGLWKTYLAHQMDVSTEGVHLGMDEIERVLPPETLARLERELDGTEVPAADRSRLVSTRTVDSHRYRYEEGTR